MEELVQQNKNQVSLNNENSCLNNTQTQHSSVILQVPLILKDKDLKPFWNKQCQEIQSCLWLPHKTVSQDQVSNLSNMSLNYQVEQSYFWKKKLKPLSNLTQQNLSASSLPSVIAITENALLQDAIIVGTKKIRIFPKNNDAYHQANTLFRRAYNLAMDHYINGTYLDINGEFINFRPSIKTIVKKEQNDKNHPYSSVIADNGVLAAKQTFLTVCKNNKNLKGNKSGFSSLSFKSKKGVKHSFKIDRLPKSGMPNKKLLGDIFITEAIPEEAYNKTAIITCDKGRWYLNVQQHITLKNEIQGQVKCVAIDQGVRTFATTYSPNEVSFCGENFAKTTLFPLMKKVDSYISQKQKLFNLFTDVKFNDLPQWTKDRITHCDKKIVKLKCKKEDLINDLHHRFAFDLVSNFDCIFLPTFETRSMVKRQGKVRTIRRNTARQMLDLGHYKFKMLLKWYAKKYGKKVIDCNEAYTSKTRSWNGEIDLKLQGKKIIKDKDISVDRDINGARNIFIKCLTR
jgi:putative transposase